MFSHNGLISQKQENCILGLTVFTGSILVLPHLFVRMFPHDLIKGIIIFLIEAVVYTSVIIASGKKDYKCDERTNPDGESELGKRGCDREERTSPGVENKLGKRGYTCGEKANSGGGSKSGKRGGWRNILNIARGYIRLIFYIILAMAVLSEGQVPFVDKEAGNAAGNLIVLLPLVLVALYGAGKDLEKQGRIAEMIFAAAILPYLVMLLFGIKDADLHSIFQGLFTQEKESVLKVAVKCYALLTFVVPVEIYPWLKINKTGRKNNKLISSLSVTVMLMLIGTAAVIMAAICGTVKMAQDAMISIAIMRYIELPLGVLQRFDVLMVWFYMTGCFFLLCSTMFVLRQQLLMFVSKEKTDILMIITAAALMITVYSLPQYQELIYPFVVYGAFVDVPLSVITSVNIGKVGGRKVLPVLAAVLLSLGLCGCSSHIESIEQRDYATVIMILPVDNDKTYGTHLRSEDYQQNGGEARRFIYVTGIAKEHRNGEKGDAERVYETGADDIEELYDIYGRENGKELSLSHLKAILTGVNISGENRDAAYGKQTMKDILADLDDEDEVAKTCPLLLVEDGGKLKKYLYNAEKPVGTYISDLVRNAGKNDEKIPKLMDYLKAMGERTYVKKYAIESDDEYLQLKCIK